MDNQLNHVSDDLSPFDGFVRRSPIADETELLDLRSHNIGNIDWIILGDAGASLTDQVKPEKAQDVDK